MMIPKKIKKNAAHLKALSLLFETIRQYIILVPHLSLFSQYSFFSLYNIIDCN